MLKEKIQDMSAFGGDPVYVLFMLIAFLGGVKKEFLFFSLGLPSPTLLLLQSVCSSGRKGLTKKNTKTSGKNLILALSRACMPCAPQS